MTGIGYYKILLRSSGITGFLYKEALQIATLGISSGNSDTIIIAAINAKLGTNLIDDRATLEKPPSEADAFVSNANKIDGFSNPADAIESLKNNSVTTTQLNLQHFLRENSDLDGINLAAGSVPATALSGCIPETKITLSSTLDSGLSTQLPSTAINTIFSIVGNSVTSNSYTPTDVTSCTLDGNGYSLGDPITLATKESSLAERIDNRDNCANWVANNTAYHFTYTAETSGCNSISEAKAYSGCVAATTGNDIFNIL